MGINLKDSIKSNIKKENKVLEDNTNIKDNTESKAPDIKNFKIGKKQEDKSIKKSFPLYMDGALQKELDKIVKKTGYSRNELINMMIRHCLDNIEFTE